jgi:hypothetical protein
MRRRLPSCTGSASASRSAAANLNLPMTINEDNSC